MSSAGRWPAALVVASVFVAAQFAMIGFARTTDLRYFTWAPHDQQARFEISVHIDGEPLSPDDVHDRYGRSRGLDPRAAAHVINIVEQYERTYGSGDDAEVVVRYWINGGEEQQWHWPPD